LTISGQFYSAAQQILTFTPLQTCPYQLPWFIPGTGGFISCNGNTFTLTVLQGQVKLNYLAVNEFYVKNVFLKQQQSISWQNTYYVI
jgi:hypothetical protein